MRDYGTHTTGLVPAGACLGTRRRRKNNLRIPPRPCAGGKGFDDYHVWFPNHLSPGTRPGGPCSSRIRFPVCSATIAHAHLVPRGHHAEHPLHEPAVCLAVGAAAAGQSGSDDRPPFRRVVSQMDPSRYTPQRGAILPWVTPEFALREQSGTRLSTPPKTPQKAVAWDGPGGTSPIWAGNASRIER